MKFPKLFEDRMKKLLGEEFNEFSQCYSKPHYGGLRVNTLKITPQAFEKICPFPITRIPWIYNGYYYDTSLQPARHPYYYAGLYYIQEPSAMTPASLLPIKEGDKVLDICAAPGGKSTELAAKLNGSGILVSNDISNSRAKALLKNLELFGARNSLILSEAPNKLADYFPSFFDKILIDAPCSGEGMFRKSPAIMSNWEQYGVDYYNKLQKEIILFAAKMLRPGGFMLYSTCTFSPEENEGTIAYLLRECPEFRVVNAIPDDHIRQRLGITYEGFDYGKPEWINEENAQLRHCIRLWPHKINGEGHFITLLQKGEGTTENVPGGSNEILRVRDKNEISREATAFINDIRLSPERTGSVNGKPGIDISRLLVRDTRLYYLPEGLPDIKGLRILRQGLLLGEMKKQRFEPSQALASALSSEEYAKTIHFKKEDPNAIRYLKCESLELKDQYEDGWYLICVDQHPLGWAKISKNNFKNKYLPGWRWV